jgi:chemotaxis protein CheX
LVLDGTQPAFGRKPSARGAEQGNDDFGQTQTRNPVMASKKAAQKSLSLAPVLDLNEATALHTQLMGLKGNPLVIDASAVERVGALCAQVLMAGAKSWEEDKQPFTFGKVSDPFMKTMQLIGVNIDHLLAQEIRQ